jgi:hypothetical protein
MTALPESMGLLKNLESLRLDAHNVKQLPESLKKLFPRLISASNADSFKYSSIVLGGKEQAISPPEKKHGSDNFNELVDMSWQYRRKLLESYSIKQLEMLLCQAPRFYRTSEKEKEVFDDIMLERFCRLKRKFKWTEENKKRLVKVSDEFLKAWEDGFAKAKMVAAALYEQDPGKERYDIEFTLHPEIVFAEEEEARSDWELYNAITARLDRDINMHFIFDPADKNEKEFREDIHISRDLSWNIEGLGDIELKDYHICYALHVLYSHNHWPPQDIVRINRILTDVEVSYDGGEF